MRKERWWVEYDSGRPVSFSRNGTGGWLPVMGGDKDRTLEEAFDYYRKCGFPSPNSPLIYRFHNPDTGESIPAIIMESL